MLDMDVRIGSTFTRHASSTRLENPTLLHCKHLKATVQAITIKAGVMFQINLITSHCAIHLYRGVMITTKGFQEEGLNMGNFLKMFEFISKYDPNMLKSSTAAAQKH